MQFVSAHTRLRVNVDRDAHADTCSGRGYLDCAAERGYAETAVVELHTYISLASPREVASTCLAHVIFFFFFFFGLFINRTEYLYTSPIPVLAHM